MERMLPRRIPEQDMRLIVLYSLQKLGPCTELQLLQFLFDNDVMNYFDMMFSLGTLCEQGLAGRTRFRAGFRYQTTPAGDETLRLFSNRVPASLQKKIEAEAAQWKRKFKKEDTLHTYVAQLPRGEFELNMTLSEQEMDLLRLTLSLPTSDMANALAARWPDKAGKVYEAIIRILTEDEA